MKVVLYLSFLLCMLCPQSGQTQDSNFISIDHIPIVTANLDKLKKVLGESLHFKIKEGRAHAGIQNCFIKFQDGTYLEFIMPVDTTQEIGKYYTNFLKDRQGASAMAISIHYSSQLITFLEENSISFTTDSNSVWKTIALKENDIFFIEYMNKQWRDSEVHTRHPNTALSLQSTFILSSNVGLDEVKYKGIGFRRQREGTFLGIPYHELALGKSALYILDVSQAHGLQQALLNQDFLGICGVEIKVQSLEVLNKLLSMSENVTFERTQTLVYLTDLNFFFVFSE